MFSHGWPLSGDDDQIVPIEAAGRRTAEPLPHATLKVCEGASLDLGGSYESAFNDDLLTFIEE